MNRREFLKTLALGMGALAVPKVITENTLSVGRVDVPDLLHIAMMRNSTIHLDALGVAIDGFSEEVDSVAAAFGNFGDAFDVVAMRRYEETLSKR